MGFWKGDKRLLQVLVDKGNGAGWCPWGSRLSDILPPDSSWVCQPHKLPLQHGPVKLSRHEKQAALVPV